METIHQEWDPEFGSHCCIHATAGTGSAMVASTVECMLYFFSEETNDSLS